MSKKKPKLMKNGRALSWHKTLKQWYRTVPCFEDGEVKKKRKYFGTGSGVSDAKSYRTALEKYSAYMDEWELLEGPRRFMQRVEVYEQGPTVLEHWLRKNRPAMYDPAQTDESIDALRESRQRLQMVRTLGRSEGVSAPDASRGMDDLVARWLKLEGRRVKSGDITPVALNSKTSGIKTFQAWCDGREFGDPKAVEQLLADYRGFLLDRHDAGRYTSHTVNDKLKFLGQFVAWAYEHRELDELPRTLVKVLAKLKVKKEGRPLTASQVRAVWRHANDRMKCFIALGLNCGFKNKDITELTASDFRGDRLISARSKTKAPMNYLLWPVTLDLIERTRQDSGGGKQDRVFRSSTGGELSPATLGALFKKVAKRADVEVGTSQKTGKPAYATFEQLRDTSAELVRKSLLDQGKDLAVLQLFLAHKDKTTAAYYTSDDPASMKSAPLDAEIKKLDQEYDLTLEAGA